MQWRRIVEPDVIDSGDEAERSGEDSELEGDGGVRCCHHKRQNTVGRRSRLRFLAYWLLLKTWYAGIHAPPPRATEHGGRFASLFGCC